MGKKLKSCFSKKTYKVQKLSEKVLTSLIIKKIQNKTTMKYHFIPVRMSLLLKRQKITSVGEDTEKRDPLYNVNGSEIGTTITENSREIPQKIKKLKFLI